jgi:hypothetical protein
MSTPQIWGIFWILRCSYNPSEGVQSEETPGKSFPIRLSNVPPSPATSTKCSFCKVCSYQYRALVRTRQERLKHRRVSPRQIAYSVMGRQSVARLRGPKSHALRKRSGSRSGSASSADFRRIPASQPVRGEQGCSTSTAALLVALMFHWLTTQTGGNGQCIH